MPEVAMSLINTFALEQPELTYVRDLIAKDPTLTATVLRMANSSMFGMRRPVNTLEAAISLVGLSAIRSKAIAICLTGVFPLPQGMSRAVFWSQSLKCAGYSMWLALAIGMEQNEAWLAGMMLRLGEVAIGQLEPQAIEKIELAPLTSTQRWQMERDLVDVDEGQVMAGIANNWNFPTQIGQALATCTQAAPAKFSQLGAVLHLASILSDHTQVDEALLQQLPMDVVHQLGLDVQWIAKYLPDAASFTDTSILGAA
jgi:HD-like signal output (HDOD) protein